MHEAAPMLTVVPPLEDGAWVPITAELMWAWRHAIEQDRKREADRPRARIPSARTNNRSVRA
jgi:hypothetical protein